jgi:molybdate transport system regulatory protein
MKLVYKLWLDSNGKAFGDGPYELLQRVKKANSLHKAAIQMSMSYSKAWRLIRTLEKRLGFPLLERKTGGLSGGGSKVTPEASRLMKQYGKLRRETEKTLTALFRKHFGQGL